MANTSKATADIINQVVDEYGLKLRFDHMSVILCSDANVAKTMYEATKEHRTSYGPQIVIASRGAEGESSSDLEGIATSTLR